MKKVLSVVAVVAVMMASLFALSGCGDNGNNKGKVETTTISYASGKLNYTVSVPKKDDGTPKYDFTSQKPDVKNLNGSFYLETENDIMAFSTSSLVYTTSIYYKEKYGANQKGTFDGFINWINDPDSKTDTKYYTQLEVNGRKALRLDRKEGSPGNYKYYGYTYMIAADDVLPGAYIQISTVFKGDEELTSRKDLDEEAQNIINSLVVKTNE